MEERGADPTLLSDVTERVQKLDFTKLNRKLQYDDPDFWTDDRLERAEAGYRRFLVLNALYPEETLAVNRLIDDYWHAHILDTRSYASDCDAVFGRPLHHYPYYGLPGEPDEGQNVESLAVTEAIWNETFGRDMLDQPIEKARLTLDRVLGGLDRAGGPGDPDGGPKGCKNGQHCSKIIAPADLVVTDPIVAVSTKALR